MASLRKRKTSNFWVACYTDVQGARRQRSTGIEDDGSKETKRKAQEIADTFEKAARGIATAHQIHAVIKETYSGVREARQLSNRTIRSYFQHWVDGKKGEVADSTLKFYTSAKNKFLKFLGDRADQDLAVISKDDILAYRAHVAASRTSKTVNHNLKAVRMVFRSGVSDGLIAQNPAEFVKTLKHTENDSDAKRRPFTMGELKVLLTISDEEWHSMILFGLYTGQRLGDIAKLRWENIDFERGVFRGVQTQKTGRALNLPLAKPLLKFLKPLREGKKHDTLIHPKAAAIASTQKKTGTLSRQFYDLMAKAGIVEKKAHRVGTGKGRDGLHRVSPISFHSLRHTMTSLLHNAGVGSAVAQELVGHDSPAIHQVYTHLEPDTLKRALDLLPDYVS